MRLSTTRPPDCRIPPPYDWAFWLPPSDPRTVQFVTVPSVSRMPSPFFTYEGDPVDPPFDFPPTTARF